MSDDIKFTKTARDWRRNIVLSKLSKGYTQAEIAKELKLHPSTISLDVHYLKEKACNELKTHLTERLPWEHARVTNGINDLLKKTHEILERTTDPKMRLQTISVLTGLYSTVMTLATDAGVIEQSLKRSEVMQDKNEAVFSAEDVRDNEGKENEKEDFQEDEEPEQTPIEQDEDLQEE